MLANNGKLYCMTNQGGTYNNGILFEYDVITNTIIVKHNFDGINGSMPQGNLIQTSNGKLYGMTNLGGVNNNGVIFEYDINTGAYIKKIDFIAATGSNPGTELIEATNGKLYGMTTNGGINNYGVIFEYDITTNTYLKKFDFNGSSNGGNPFGAMSEVSGKLYGMTQYSGTSSSGVIFEYDYITNSYSKKINLGGSPYGSFVKAANGSLYGLTYESGTYTAGFLFEYNPATSNFNKKKDFDGFTDGGHPRGTLMQSSNGKLYGLTAYGGDNHEGAGVIFEYDIANDIYLKKINFYQSINGGRPWGSMIRASNNKLYGITYFGGNDENGVLFEIDPYTKVYTKKIDFNLTMHGGSPMSSLIQASNGMLYGIATQSGYPNYYAILYEYDYTTGNYNIKHTFNNSFNGVLSGTSSLFQASNGKLYGVTNLGGINNNGVLYEFDPVTNNYSKLYDFAWLAGGADPEGSVIEENGILYGVTSSGNNSLFSYNLNTQTLSFIHTFTNSDGRYPIGPPVKAINNKLYGLTYAGGANNMGTLYEYDMSLNLFTKKIDFNGALNGSNPQGTLMSASNGKLYGATSYGGNSNFGTTFEYDPTTNTLIKKISFDGQNGNFPTYSKLVEVPIIENINELDSENSTLNIFPIPTNSSVFINSEKDFTKLELLSITGQILLSEKIATKTYHLPLQHFAEGIYFVRITYANGLNNTKKIFVNR
jgi:uncharacterized repeat protein (TIGR03803 family)